MTEIIYRFHLPSGIEEIALDFDPDSFLLHTLPEAPPPDWALLDFHKCRHCPLSSADNPTCPFAFALSGYVDAFGHLVSHEEVEIEVVMPTRHISARRPLQSGIASMVGLIGATSGCPHLAFYRPMARFHLPFAEEEETLYRVISMFLMRGLLLDDSTAMEELNHVMADVCMVNAAMAERIRGGFTEDAMVNAIVVLDCFAMTVPLAIESRFDSLRKLFKS